VLFGSEVVDGPAAMLVRPDGYVAWAADEPDKPGLDEAVHRWAGRAKIRTASRECRP